MTMKKIFRPTLNALVDDYAAGNLTRGNGSPSMNFQRLQKVLVKNNTRGNLDVGDLVSIYGLPNQISYDDLIVEYLTTGFVFSATNDSGHVSAITMEPIKKGCIGEVYLPNIIAAKVYNYVSNYRYAVIDEGKLKASTWGEYQIVGASSANNDSVCFAYVIPSKDRYLIGYTTDTLDGPNATTDIRSNRVTIATNAKCPLLRVGETLDSGTKVIISKSNSLGEWQIIEAQCPDRS